MTASYSLNPTTVWGFGSPFVGCVNANAVGLRILTRWATGLLMSAASNIFKTQPNWIIANTLLCARSSTYARTYVRVLCRREAVSCDTLHCISDTSFVVVSRAALVAVAGDALFLSLFSPQSFPSRDTCPALVTFSLPQKIRPGLASRACLQQSRLPSLFFEDKI